MSSSINRVVWLGLAGGPRPGEVTKEGTHLELDPKARELLDVGHRHRELLPSEEGARGPGQVASSVLRPASDAGRETPQAA